MTHISITLEQETKKGIENFRKKFNKNNDTNISLSQAINIMCKKGLKITV